MSNIIVLLGKQFTKILKSLDRRVKPNVKNISYDISKEENFQENTLKERPIKAKPFNAMSVKILVTSNLNVPLFSRGRRRDLLCLGLMMMMNQKMRLTMNLQNLWWLFLEDGRIKWELMMIVISLKL